MKLTDKDGNKYSFNLENDITWSIPEGGGECHSQEVWRSANSKIVGPQSAPVTPVSPSPPFTGLSLTFGSLEDRVEALEKELRRIARRVPPPPLGSK